jgi:hypothetical protein
MSLPKKDGPASASQPNRDDMRLPVLQLRGVNYHGLIVAPFAAVLARAGHLR